VKTTTIIAAAALMFAGLMASDALAFHDGGVASCEGCHTMHNSKNGAAVNSAVAQFTGVQYLLKGSDQSSTCLNCHAAADAAPTRYHIMTYPVPADGTAPAEMTPGGDFAYLGKSYSWTTSYYAPGSSAGERHGHNVIALDFGLIADSTLATAPGGTYAGGNLHCSSCHDPHGQTRIHSDGSQDRNVTIGVASEPIGESGSYGATPVVGEAVGVYRLLGGVGYVPKSYSGGPAFGAGAPDAITPSTYNRSEAATDTRVAYGQGMSEWCANCHTDIHNDSLASKLIHPASNAAKLTSEVTDNYNAYVASGDLTNTVATSYSSLVPYEEGTGDRATLTSHAVNDGSVTTGPSTGNENVMCLSCHRAHASAYDSMTRWQNYSEFVTLDGSFPGTDAAGHAAYGQYAQGKTMAENQAALYGRDIGAFATFQRSLCNKCHAKD
jgi:hypothetical protein